MKHDVTESLDGLRGEDFVTGLRALVLIATVDNGLVLCAGCGGPATLIGMHRCGAPGGPICTACCAAHFAWILSWDTVQNAVPSCSHCGDDVDHTHIYAVDLFDETAPEVLVNDWRDA